MKNKFLKIFVFIFIVIFFDKIGGIVCEKLYAKSKDYNIHRLRYTLDSTKQDILIFGSSRAQYHFIPSIINNTTGLTSYNCGFAGQGLLFSYIQLHESLKRYKPRLVVLEVSPNILIDPESQRKLKILTPFHKKDPVIFNALTDGEVFEKVKLLSSIYPYNSTIASLITGRYKTDLDTLNGFIPLEGKIDTIGLINEMNRSFPTTSELSEKLNVLKQFITLCNNNNIKIAIVVTPVYQSNTNLDAMTKDIESSCQGFKNLYFLNYSKLDTTFQHITYFKDKLHLNYEGAKIFSAIVSEKLKEIIAQ